jgi:DegV family protein with EDD domain
MVGQVVVVTDSTAYLPSGWAEKAGVLVVPVQVVIAGQAYDETDDEQAEIVSRALADWKPVTTSRPSPERFLQAFRAAKDAGARHVVVATLSGALSATHESAVLAARESPIAVTVIDSRTIAMGLGFGVISGAEMASMGASPEAVAAVIEQRFSTTQVTFYVDTMEYLRRGGRVSAARAAVGQVLQVKPLLRIDDGRVVMLEKVRTAGRALARLADIAVEAAGDQDVDIAVQHLSAPERANELAARIGERLPDAEIVVCPVGGVVGAHVGPGMVATVVSPRVPR